MFCHNSQVFHFTSLPFSLATAPQVFTMIVKEVKLMGLTRGVINQEWIINQEKYKLKPTQVFSFVGYEYNLNSALVKPTQERWCKLPDLILCLKSKHVACLNGEDGPEGMPSHEGLSISPQGALEISSVVGHPPSLVRDNFSSRRMVAKW